jgi:lysophospholipase L1-like esterase
VRLEERIACSLSPFALQIIVSHESQLSSLLVLFFRTSFVFCLSNQCFRFTPERWLLSDGVLDFLTSQWRPTPQPQQSAHTSPLLLLLPATEKPLAALCILNSSLRRSSSACSGCCVSNPLLHSSAALQHISRNHAGFSSISLASKGVGDSLTDGYYDFGAKFHPYAVKLQQLIDIPVDRIGLSGWTTSDLVGGIEQEHCTDCNGKVWPGLRRQLNLHSYSHCVIMAGTNDICDTPAHVTIANLQQLRRVVLQHVPFAATMTIPEISVEQRHASVKKRREEINAALLAEPPCIDVAIHLPLASADACARDLLWQADGLHLNPVGYDRIAEVVAAFLTQPIRVSSE